MGFEPMGLFQQDLKKIIYQNVLKPKGKQKPSWVDKLKTSLHTRAQLQYINRYYWTGLPDGYDSQQIERMLYYRALLGMTYVKEFGFIILPIKMHADKENSNIDFMGRWKNASLVPFNGSAEDTKPTPDEKLNKVVLETIGSKVVRHSIPVVKNLDEAKQIMRDSIVLLYDYTPQISELPISRSFTDTIYLEGESEILKMIRTASLNSCGVTWVRVQTEAERKILEEQFIVYDQLVLEGNRYLAISSAMDMQEGSTKSTAQMMEFWNSWQSLENLRLSSAGIANDGMIQKSTYQNINEQMLDNIGNNPIIIDGWFQRLKFCSIANAIWGTNINCHIMGADTDINQGAQTESADTGSDGSVESPKEN